MAESNPYFHFRVRRSRSVRGRPAMHLPHPVWIDPNLPGRPRGLVPPDSIEYDAFCNCWKERYTVNKCTCGELGKTLEWVWDVDTKSNCTHLVNNNKDVRFHLHFSGGTAVIKGNRAIVSNQHYWEVKMTSLVYGTDMMVGIGTKDADVHKLSDKFCSVLGIDAETWGLSYTGLFHHQGLATPFSSGFGQGAIIGVHLDMWNGTLSFYKNRQLLGTACRGLKGKTLYPMVSSTAARSGMRIIHSVSFPSSLQFLCCVALRKAVGPDVNVFDTVKMPPGMQIFLGNNLGWLLGDSSLVTQHAAQHMNDNAQPGPSLTCQHKHLTCNDCNTPVFAGSSKAADEAFLQLTPSRLLQVGPVLLQGCRYRAPPRGPEPTHSRRANSETEEAEHQPPQRSGRGTGSKKRRKISHKSAAGSSKDKK